MSSCGNPTVEADALMPRKRKFDKSKNCVKCKTNSGNIVIRHTVYCKDCFIPFVTHKFRRSLELSADGSRQTNLKTGNVLLAFSGGLGSSLLLGLFSKVYFSPDHPLGDDGKPKGGKDHPRNARARGKVYVCYVEVCNAFPGMRDRTEDVRTVVQQCSEFEFIPLRIENAFDRRWWERVGGKPITSGMAVDMMEEDLILSGIPEPSDEPIENLRSFMTALPTQTAVLSATQTFIRLLLLYTAHSTNSLHVILGTTLTSLSVNHISSISQGGGFVVREEVEEDWHPPKVFVDQELPSNDTLLHGSIRINRPLRDVGRKECIAWAWWSGMRVARQEFFPAAKQAIAGLTNEFIVSLERDYPSTVSTIVRTCGKVAPKDSPLSKCTLCQKPSQPGVQDWKSRISIRSLPALDSETNLYAPLPNRNMMPLSTLTPSLASELCYACHATLTSRSSRGVTRGSKATAESLENMVPLPVWVQPLLSESTTLPVAISVNGCLEEHEVFRGKKLCRTEMRSAVSEYLLED